MQRVYTMHPQLSKKILLTLAIVLLTACSAPPAPRLKDLPGPYGSLTVDIYGFRDLKGDVLLSLFLNGEGFPDDTGRALVNLSLPVDSGRVRFELPPLPYGTYSYSVLHDENRNGSMDSSLLGIPREGYAFSNDLEGNYGPPPGEEALFELAGVPLEHALRIHYFKRKGKRFGPFGN